MRGNPEKIATKEVTRGRHHQSRRQAGTEEAETRCPQESRPQGEAHRSARREKEEGQKAGSRSVQALSRSLGPILGRWPRRRGAEIIPLSRGAQVARRWGPGNRTLPLKVGAPGPRCPKARHLGHPVLVETFAFPDPGHSPSLCAFTARIGQPSLSTVGFRIPMGSPHPVHCGEGILNRAQNRQPEAARK
jgi:hypothetical protein